MKTLDTMKEDEMQAYCKAAADAIKRTAKEFDVQGQEFVLLIFNGRGGHVQCISDSAERTCLGALLTAARPLEERVLR